MGTKLMALMGVLATASLATFPMYFVASNPALTQMQEFIAYGYAGIVGIVVFCILMRFIPRRERKAATAS